MVYNYDGMSNRLAHYALWQWFLAGIALAFIGVYLVVGISRVMYPYDLDFIEDSILMQAYQMAQARPQWVAPNADYVPQVYMPLYTWLGGIFLRWSGPALWPLRLLSFAATLITASLIYVIAQREAHSRLVGLICAALFLAGYRVVGGWYDLARVDPLFVTLVVAGMALTVYGAKRWWGVWTAAACLAFSFLTKQNGLFLGLGVGAYWLWLRPRALPPYLVVFLFLTVVPLLWVEASSQGWFSYYAGDVAYASPIEIRRVWRTLQWEILGAMGGLVLCGLCAIGLLINRQPPGSELLTQPWFWFTGLALIVTLAGRASVGGNLNNLIPGYTLLCIMPALFYREITLKKRRLISLWVLLVLLQFALTQRNPITNAPTQYIPTATMKAEGDQLIAYIQSLEGEVWMTMHPYYTLLAGKKPSVHVQMLWHARLRGQQPLPDNLVERITNQTYTAIISDEHPLFEQEPVLAELFHTYYEPHNLSLYTTAPPMLSGLITQPRIIYFPRTIFHESNQQAVSLVHD